MLTFTTKVMPAILGGGIAFVAYNHFMNPLSEEELRELTRQRTKKRPGKVLDESELKLPFMSGVDRELLNAKNAHAALSTKNDQENRSSNEDKLKAS